MSRTLPLFPLDTESTTRKPAEAPAPASPAPAAEAGKARLPIIRQEVPGTRHEAPGTRQEVPGTRQEVPGTRQEVPGGPVLRPGRGLVDKLAVLADAAKYDASCASSGAKRSGRKGKLGHTDGVGICHSYTPDGRCISLLKLLLTNYCIYDCQFCVNRISSDTRRARFRPEEVVELTIDFYRRNYIEGLFLSSGIIQSPDYTMEQLIAVARLLRTEHGFGGYIHLKAVPGAAEDLLAEAGRWADRLSANVELPSQGDLDQLAPEKQMTVIEEAMATIRSRRDEAKEERKKSRRAPRFAPAGQSTQMVVGATDTRDASILSAASRLYGTHNLKRIYYSAFSPIPHGDARLPAQSPPLVREHRLYQADWLMRFYGFDAGELTDEARPDLDLELDPKTVWALENRDFFPVDINRASRAALLRVPGIGVRNAKRIVRIRRWQRLRVEDLVKLRVVVKRALPFIVAADRNPEVFTLDTEGLRARLVAAKAPPSRQLELFPFPAAGSGLVGADGRPATASKGSDSETTTSETTTSRTTEWATAPGMPPGAPPRPAAPSHVPDDFSAVTGEL